MAWLSINRRIKKFQMYNENILQTVANFVVSILALGYLKNEFDDIREVIEEQGELGEGLGTDAKHLRKRVSANCQKVKRTSQAFCYKSVGLVYIRTRNLPGQCLGDIFSTLDFPPRGNTYCHV